MPVEVYARAERSKRWAEENREFIDGYNKLIEETDLFAAEWRTF